MSIFSCKWNTNKSQLSIERIHQKRSVIRIKNSNYNITQVYRERKKQFISIKKTINRNRRKRFRDVTFFFRSNRYDNNLILIISRMETTCLQLQRTGNN